MDKKKILNELRAIGELSDMETGHIAADDALLEYINDPDIEKAYNKIGKWYA